MFLAQEVANRELSLLFDKPFGMTYHPRLHHWNQDEKYLIMRTMWNLCRDKSLKAAVSIFSHVVLPSRACGPFLSFRDKLGASPLHLLALCQHFFPLLKLT